MTIGDKWHESCLIGLDDYKNDGGGITLSVLSSNMMKKQEKKIILLL